MCEPLSGSPRRTNTTKVQREAELARWIAEDQLAGLPGLPNALEKWRMCVLQRISPLRPLGRKIPECFVRHLNLPSQDVVFRKDQSVWYKHSLGLVPRPYTESDDDWRCLIPAKEEVAA